MNEVSLLEAWSLWLRGQTLGSYYLWGVQILWWGRVGKIVGLLSALSVFAELIGPERIRVFGKSLHSQFTVTKAWQIIRGSFRSLTLLLGFFTASKQDADELLNEFLFRTPVGWLTILSRFYCWATFY